MKRHQLGAAAAVVAVAALAYIGVIRPGSDSAERSPQPTVGATTATVRVMTWNICGEAGDCYAQTNPAGQAKAVADLARTKSLDAVFLQEICGEEYKNDKSYDANKSEDADSLLTHVEQQLDALGADWNLAFLPYDRLAQDRWGASITVKPSVTREYPVRKHNNAPATSNFRCRGSLIPGVQGMTIAVKGTFGDPYEYELPSPQAGISLKALCVRRTSHTPVRFCTTHLTPPGEDLDARAGFSYRVAQIQRLTEITGTGTDTVFGGDLNNRPPGDSAAGSEASNLVPLYTAYRECQQLGTTARKGSPTKWSRSAQADPAGGPLTWVYKRESQQYDYLFAKNSFASCEVVTSTQEWSDHLPVVGTVSVTTS
ncbi:endonuclease/exonuclease/phosphatase family protein [Streptomyces lateritius]|uniref:Endonuclease/exonuclease/phosphatase family protein n=1 Tax=Streptomyces lateritius TaxID=67313 RepID=A0ABW6YFB3_9ACTN